MKRSTRFTAYAAIFTLIELFEVLVPFYWLASPRIEAIAAVAVLSAMITSALVIFCIWRAGDWKKKEERFLRVAKRNPPHSFKDIEGMSALRDEIAGLFQPVHHAMIKRTELTRQKMPSTLMERWKLDVQIRDGREAHTALREASLPFLTPEFRPPSERTLSDALRFRLRCQLKAKA